MEKTYPKLQKPPFYRFIAFFLMVIPYITLYAGQQIIASLYSSIMTDLNIAASQLSLLSAIGSLPMALASLLVSFLLVKMRGKTVVIIGCAIYVLAGIFYFLKPGTWGMLLCVRVLQGTGAGVMSATLMGLVCAWFPKSQRGKAQGALGCFYGVAISLVTVYTFKMSSLNLPWNQVIAYMLMVLGAGAGILIFAFYKDIQKAYGVNIIDEALEGYDADEEARAAVETVAADEAGGYHKPENFKEALRSPVFWLVGFSLFFFCSGCYGIAFVMPLFLNGVGFDAAASTAIMGVGTLSSIIFSLCGGHLSDKFFHARRAETNMIAFGGAAVLVVITAFIAGSLSTTAMTILFFITYGVLYLDAGPAWCLPTETVAPSFAASNMGIALLFSGMGGFVMVQVFGKIIDVAGVQWGMVALALSMLAQCALSLVIKLKYKA